MYEIKYNIIIIYNIKNIYVVMIILIDFYLYNIDFSLIKIK